VVIVGDPVVLDTSPEVRAEVPLPKGTYDQVLVAVLMTEADALVARALIVPEIVTPAPAVGVHAPAPRLRMFMRVPTTYATDELAGMVSVVAPAFVMLTVFPASVRTVV
jgi:ribosomal protein L1